MDLFEKRFSSSSIEQFFEHDLEVHRKTYFTEHLVPSFFAMTISFTYVQLLPRFLDPIIF